MFLNDIKISRVNSIQFWVALEIAGKYIKENETEKIYNDTFFLYERNIKITGKHPIKIKRGYNNYWLTCRKTKTMYIIEIRNAI